MFQVKRWTSVLATLTVILFGAKVARAGEHPHEHPSEHPAASKAESPAKAAEEKKAARVTKEELAEVITTFVDNDADLKGGYFLVFDKESNMPLALTLEKVHKERLSRVDKDVYFACADFRTHDGKMVYDLDVFMRGPDKAHLKVTEISVHKENGVERYGWMEKDGVWSKSPMKKEAGKKEWKGSDHEGEEKGEHSKEHPSEHPAGK